MTEAPHPGDCLITYAALLSVEFKGSEDIGYRAIVPGGHQTSIYYAQRACAAEALRMMGYKICDDGSIELR